MSDSRPNVLLLLTDQERTELTADESLPVETPSIDRLREAGVWFSRAYTPISICSSARASLLTGLYPHNHGTLNNVHEADAIQPDLPDHLPTVTERLADAGYRNTQAGKWHVGREQRPETYGMEHIGGSDVHHDAALEDDFREYQRELGIDPDGIALEDETYVEWADENLLLAATTPIPVEATRAYYLAELTIDRLEAAAEEDDPFFHRTDFLGPHHPYVVPEPYASMYDPDDVAPWESFAETFADKPQVQENYLSYRGVADFDWEQWAALVASYMGFMTLIDEQLGRILDALDEFGLAAETMVVHASDHGDFAGGHRQFNKGPLMYEDTYHIPLTITGPGVHGAGRECDALVSFLDLMPTVLETAGVEVPAVDGESLRPLLESDREAVEWHDAAFAEYHGDEFGLYSQRMVVTDRYKLVYNAPDVDELYDLESDPAELHNLVDHPAYQDVRRRLGELLLEHMDATDDPIHRWTRKHMQRRR